MTSTSESENSEDIGRTAVVLSSPKNAHKFVDDWLMFNTVLGEGAYGEVRLVLNKKTNEKVACKIINMSKIKGNERIVSKEIRLHTLTTHHNIIRCFGLRKDVDRVYLFLEYASGGELFQQIEPGVGMPVRKVQNYMKQLVDAVMYLHQKGIAHRDIKPENILLGENGVLKLSDFGLATIFRYKGKERMLDAKCGTKPYLAHEVLLGPYHAVPADIWSCGCVLVAMLVGELLWDCPTESSREFRVYKEGNFLSTSPWNRLANLPLNLVTKLLNINPNKRISLENVLKHPWMTYEFSNDYKSNSVDNPDGLVRGASLMEAVNVVRETNVTLSQPNLPSKPICLNKIINDQPKISNKNGNLWFSQPVSNEDLIITPPWKFREAPITKDNFDDFVKRLTRFFVTTSTVEQGIEVLCTTLDKLRYTWTVDCTGTVTISTVDNIKNQLIFKVMPIKMETKILFDFRLTKGCGLEFKRKFIKIKECVSHIVDKENS